MRAQTRGIEGFEFWLVGSPMIQRTADGKLAEYTHELPEGQRANAYAAGPFCKFGLTAAPKASGVYAVFVDGQLKYLGRCENMEARFGSGGYGSISPRNLHNDGQGTNCKLNAKVLAVAKAQGVTEVWFHGTPDFASVEASLIGKLKPEWNGRVPSLEIKKTNRPPLKGGSKPPTVRHDGRVSVSSRGFASELETLLNEGSSRGLESVEITAGELHRIVGGYPGVNHQMPVCCSRMRAAMRPGDQILHAPPKGNGASVRIKYLLPR